MELFAEADHFGEGLVAFPAQFAIVMLEHPDPGLQRLYLFDEVGRLVGAGGSAAGFVGALPVGWAAVAGRGPGAAFDGERLAAVRAAPGALDRHDGSVEPVTDRS